MFSFQTHRLLVHLQELLVRLVHEHATQDVNWWQTLRRCNWCNDVLLDSLWSPTIPGGLYTVKGGRALLMMAVALARARSRSGSPEWLRLSQKVVGKKDGVTRAEALVLILTLSAQRPPPQR